MKLLSTIALWAVVLSAVSARAPAPPHRRAPPPGPEYSPSNRGPPEEPGPEIIDPPEKIVFANETGEGIDDVHYTEEQLRWHRTPHDQRSGMKDPTSRWPGAVIPYTMDSSLDPKQAALVPEGLKMIEDNTCVRFVEHTTEDDYVEIRHKDKGCYARMGKLGGMQDMNLDGTCPAGTVAHEMMHTLGIEHEHKRYDRDDYIYIDWQEFQKLDEDWQYQYEKDDPETRDTFGLEYGYDSIMHYHPYSPRDQSVRLIYPRQRGKGRMMGQRSRLNQNDIDLINTMYCK